MLANNEEMRFKSRRDPSEKESVTAPVRPVDKVVEDSFYLLKYFYLY